MKSDYFQILHTYEFDPKEQHSTYLAKNELFETVGLTFANYIEGADSIIHCTFFCKIVETMNCFDGQILIKTIKKNYLNCSRIF